MKTGIITFILVSVVTIIANEVLKKISPKSPIPSTNKTAFLFNRQKSLLLASRLVISAWTTIIACPFIYIASYFNLLNFDSAFKIWVCLLLAFVIFYGVLAFNLSCTNCGRKFLVQWTNEAPEFSESIFGLTGWSATILNVFLKKQFRCMYCGQMFKLSKMEKKGAV